MPNEKYKPVDSVQDEGITVRSFLNGDRAVAELYENGAPVCSETAEVNEEGEGYALKAAVYNMLKRSSYIPPWGMMTGIRPAKKANAYMDEGLTPEESAGKLTRLYEASREKADLAVEVALAERNILKGSSKRSQSLCRHTVLPQRCLYCSFTSYPLDKYRDRVDAYLDALIKELRFLGRKGRGKAPGFHIYRRRNAHIPERGTA